MKTLRTPSLVLLTAFTAMAQLQPARTFILIGPPGSGKTVQADALKKANKIPAISMAQLLHREINRKSAIGKALAASLASGDLLAEGPSNDLVKTRLTRPDAARGFILDGFPTTEAQAKVFDEWLVERGLPKPIIVILDVPEAVSRERMTQRGRPGDDPVNIERRLSDYRDVGRMVEKWYGSERLVRVDGTGPASTVQARIAKGVETIQSNPVLKTRPASER